MFDQIVVDGLTKRYGDFLAVDDVSFRVGAGEVFGFLGPNGAGKSTVIRAMLGFLRSDADRIELLGLDARTESELIEAKRRIGYISAEGSFHEGRTGTEILDYFEAVRGGSRRAELSELFTPPLAKPVGEYSTGNKKKLAFILAFMHDPDLVVMDEPTSGLDPLMQRTVYEFVREECADGTTIFFSSHVLGEVQKIADRVGIIRNGEMVAVEDIRTLMRKSGKVVTAEAEGGFDPADFEFDGAERVDVDGTTMELVVTHDYDRLLTRLAAYDIVDVTIRETTLEDVFLHFYRDD
ncbi:ABC transporter ATP-binding protein [Halorubrum sp. DTA98]|uniref:ABC transporter ATP-binding protein n=1 Tax=Halorubrum sp. DTA98 TaxID=3402163 RepID=UPI003AACA29E